MVGIDDNLPLMGDWPPTTPRTQALLSTILGEDILPENGNRNEVSLPVSWKQNKSVDSLDNNVGEGGREEADLSVEECAESSIPKPEFRDGLAERVAARAGFNAPKLNTNNIRSDNLGSLFFPGFSPSAFMDSPVFLLNSLAQLSPTTGKFPLEQYNNSGSSSAFGLSDKYKDIDTKPTQMPFADVDMEPIVFKPHIDQSFSFSSRMEDKMDSTSDHRRSFPRKEDPVVKPDVDGNPQNQQGVDPLCIFPEPQDINSLSGFSESFGKEEISIGSTFDEKPSDSATCNENSPPPVNQLEGEDYKKEFYSVAIGQLSEDGYNWRKYGQKQVKGSEFPRSYYRCTHPKCEVKKKVERSPEGQVTEIIYKGTHIHPKPPVNNQPSHTSSHPLGDMQINGSKSHGMQSSMEERTMWASIFNETANSSDWRSDSVDVSASAPLASEFCEPSVSMETHDLPCFESAVHASSTRSNEEYDREKHRSISMGVDGDEESDSKRRKLEESVIDMTASSRAVCEPRVVVQTTSEVDILDDGFRWRKYGQKVVKGNPNPRSYYKCTSIGCTVRKHVERASHDLKSVITTYEGKHNHDVPAVRNNTHSNSGSAATTAASPSYNIQRWSDPCQVQESFARLEEPKLFAGFGLPPGRDQLGSPAGFSFGLSQRELNNLAMVGLVPAGSMKMLPQVHSYLGQHLLSGPGYMIPKGEPMEESVASNGASAYQNIVGRPSLGSQM